MSKYSKRKPVSKKKEIESRPFFNVFCFNLIGIAIAYFMINLLLMAVPSYDWVYNSLAKRNLSIIEQYPDLSLREKWRIKNGDSFAFLDFLNSKTPEDAVVIFPEKISNQKFSWLTDLSWSLFFSYPRIFVKKVEDAKYFGKHITHVAIIDGEGHKELLSDENLAEFGVYPLEEE